MTGCPPATTCGCRRAGEEESIHLQVGAMNRLNLVDKSGRIEATG
jgi:hypothetical protein